ncbi:MAG: hypothetical protein WC694_02580 [Candidatus Paceibacterota bacterium]|jgi:hypothetical protein
MSKRNFILLIIIIVITLTSVFGYFYLNSTTNTPEEDSVGTNFISQFNPFGNNSTNTPNTANPPSETPEYQPNPTEIVNLKLKKVSSMPIAGFTVFSKERLKEINPTPTLPLSGEGVVPPAKGDTGGLKTTKPTPPQTEFMPALRYVERATGNIYQTFVDKIEEKKFSATIIPKIYEAFFGNKGNSVIMRYLKGDGKTIITFVGTLPKEFLGADATESNEIKGTFLPENIKDLSLSSDSNSIFYLFLNGNNLGNGIIGTTFNLSKNKKVQVFDSPFSEWLSFFPNSKMITLTTKPSSGIPGYMYAMDPNNKNYNFHKILGDINGLTTLTSPNGKLVLYSNNNLTLNIFHTDTKVSDTLGVKTLAEKCIWNKTNDVVYCGVPKSITNGQYPDSWYQGEVSFRDQIWKIDIKTGNTTLVADPATLGGEDVDSIKLALDDKEDYLFFVNKKDSFLWELALK